MNPLDAPHEPRVLKNAGPMPAEMSAAAADAAKILTVFLFNEVRLNPPGSAKAARQLALRAVAQLRDAGLIPGTGARRSPESRIASLAAQGEKPIRGVSHLIAEILVLLDLDEVHRDVIWAILPDSAKASPKLNAAIRKFDQWGWIHRTQSGTLRVLDRDGLTGWFTAARDLNAGRRLSTLNIAAAVKAINEGFDSSDSVSDRELRRRELLAVKRLMESAPGAVTHERGTVRVVPKGAAL